MPGREIPFTVALFLVVGTFAGCLNVRSSMGLLEQTAPSTRLSSRKLRVLVTDFVPQFANRVEQVADAILSQTAEPRIRRNALLWKSNAIAACFRAASRPDPFAAYLDVRILTRQMTEFLEQPGPGADPVFGPWQAQAAQAARQLEAPLAEMGAMLGSNDSYYERFVDAYARSHPITSLYFQRESVAVPFIEDLREPGRDMLDVVAEVSQNLADIQRLSALFADFVPKQARWQAELLLIASTEETGPLAGPLQHMGTASQAFDRLAATSETVPQLVERERDALRGIVREERTESLLRIDQMRTDTLEALRLERAVILQSIHDERLGLNRDLDATVTRAINQVDGLVGQRGRELREFAEILAARIWQRILRLLLLAGLSLAAGFIALAWYAMISSSRRPQPQIETCTETGIRPDETGTRHSRAA